MKTYHQLNSKKRLEEGLCSSGQKTVYKARKVWSQKPQSINKAGYCAGTTTLQKND